MQETLWEKKSRLGLRVLRGFLKIKLSTFDGTHSYSRSKEHNAQDVYFVKNVLLQTHAEQQMRNSAAVIYKVVVDFDHILDKRSCLTLEPRLSPVVPTPLCSWCPPFAGDDEPPFSFSLNEPLFLFAPQQTKPGEALEWRSIHGVWQATATPLEVPVRERLPYRRKHLLLSCLTD